MCRACSLLRVVLPLVLLPAAAAADRPVSPGEFEARATGRTLHFTEGGLPYGSEQFFAGRRTLWRAWDGSCQAGVWYDAGELVCFRYEGEPEPDCWRLREAAGRLRAVLVEDGVETGPALELGGSDAARLDCPGPDLGS